jgi:catechol 2,3-dioxygenase-like lactoylglutathione lyase family enzyme
MGVIGAWHTGFHVEDLDRSLDFYCGLLGFDVIWRRQVGVDYIQELLGYPGLQLHQALLKIPGTDHTLELLDYRNVDRVPVDPATANPGTAHICLYVDDVQLMFAELSARGVEFVSSPVQPTVGPNVGRSVVYMKDPDGIRIELLDAASAA